MLYMLRNRLRRAIFDRQCRAILDTPPAIPAGSSGATLISQLQHKDVLMYLLAAKSFIARARVSAVYVLNDGTLTKGDITRLRSHIPGLEVLELADFRAPYCPVGGCWERLLAVCALSRDSYVVQLDSDTLAIDDLEEVQGAIDSAAAFTIGTWDGQEVEGMAQACERAQPLVRGLWDPHVQLLAEASFDRLADCGRLNYVRGCAGFAGYPQGSIDREFVQDLSRRLRELVGAKWDAWGSEQLMSNIVVANIPHASVLPHPRYCNCNRVHPAETCFIHFVGDCRFQGGMYGALGRRIIDELSVIG